jgi:hypothetical protein
MARPLVAPSGPLALAFGHTARHDPHNRNKRPELVIARKTERRSARKASTGHGEVAVASLRVMLSLGAERDVI